MFRAITPAWNNTNLQSLARVTCSGCILAHVRAATMGAAAAELNCHPFTAGPYAFMHNGDVAGFSAIRRSMLERLSDEAFASIRGNTDSEHVFALFQDQARETRRPSPRSRNSARLPTSWPTPPPSSA